MVILLVGVTGSGKTTIGWLLAETLDWDFIDADYLHGDYHLIKLSRGVPLTNVDREPWLDGLEQVVNDSLDNFRNLIVACSLLTERDRERLQQNSADVKIVYLKGSPQLLRQRVRERRDYFMSPTILPTQLLTLEEPTTALSVDIDRSPEDLVYHIMLCLDLWDRN